MSMTEYKLNKEFMKIWQYASNNASVGHATDDNFIKLSGNWHLKLARNEHAI